MSQKTYPFLTTKYQASPISVEQVKGWLRLDISDFTDEDSKIQSLTLAAIDYVETRCNISLGVSDYQWNVSCLPTEFIDKFHVVSITKVEGVQDGIFTEIPSMYYTLTRLSERRYGVTWSSGFYSDASAFKITFKAGFEEDKIPPRLIQAIRALIAEWYDDPGDYVSEKRTLVDKLISTYRIPYAG
ncbi:hypothetical protein LZD49_28585 [Dyadobacter sp. CY261]|uniref:head-tail connector protein n=1 Tax=Dyadobacter sp. CY261 TaxID=2907203 RepID=UPI001F429E4F|nr:hypothetical protein [Dyadobacter sp. CY261]MCF0074476.1 hypothetical protein [Dyadobacter sp. CY261]